jgi:hypothetical protein
MLQDFQLNTRQRERQQLRQPGLQFAFIPYVQSTAAAARNFPAAEAVIANRTLENNARRFPVDNIVSTIADKDMRLASVSAEGAMTIDLNEPFAERRSGRCRTRR